MNKAKKVIELKLPGSERFTGGIDSYVSAFANSSGLIPGSWQKGTTPTGPLVIRGVGGSSQEAIKYCWQTSSDFYAIDTGYLGNYKNKDWHRVTHNALQNLGPIIERPHDRMKGLGYQFKEFTAGTKILVCPPSDKIMQLFTDKTATQWTEETISLLKKITDRPIEIRQKPVRRERTNSNTIQQALANDVHCLVTYNSIAATEALIEGKPAITLGENAAQLLCETNIENIENPRIPTKDEMIAFIAHLSYAQFTRAELASGYAWEVLQETI